jgi:hypothetical protein
MGAEGIPPQACAERRSHGPKVVRPVLPVGEDSVRGWLGREAYGGLVVTVSPEPEPESEPELESEPDPDPELEPETEPELGPGPPEVPPSPPELEVVATALV